MRRIFSVLVLLVTAAFIAGCDPAANTNTANKPVNASNATNASAANSAPSAAAVETEIKKQVTDMAAALQKGDAAYFEKLYTDNYMFVGPDGGVATGAQRIASMKSGDTKYDTIGYEEVSVRSNAAGDGAVSISIATVKGLNLGRRVDGKYRVTHVWSKTKDGWRLASGQTTPIAASATGQSNSSSATDSANKASANSTNTTANANK